MSSNKKRINLSFSMSSPIQRRAWKKLTEIPAGQRTAAVCRMVCEYKGQQELLDANKQTVSMLIIDKKRMKLKDAGLPQMVIDQTPKMMRGSKLPIIKAKVGPQIVSLICDEKIFDSVPVKKEVKAVVSGIYVLDVKGLHGKTEAAPEKKKGFFKRLVATAQEKAGAKPVK